AGVGHAHLTGDRLAAFIGAAGPRAGVAVSIDEAGGDVPALAIDHCDIARRPGRPAPADARHLAVLDEHPPVLDHAIGAARPDGGIGEDDGLLLGQLAHGVGAEGIAGEVAGEIRLVGILLLVILLLVGSAARGGPLEHLAITAGPGAADGVAVDQAAE